MTERRLPRLSLRDSVILAAALAALLAIVWAYGYSLHRQECDALASGTLPGNMTAYAYIQLARSCQ